MEDLPGSWPLSHFAPPEPDSEPVPGPQPEAEPEAHAEAPMEQAAEPVVATPPKAREPERRRYWRRVRIASLAALLVLVPLVLTLTAEPSSQLLSGHRSQVDSVVFSPDGATLVAAGYCSTARIWDARTGEELHVLEEHEDRVTSVAYAPDGTALATADSGGTVLIWDIG